jgi:superfamily I DNA/RNA helicase
LHWYQGLRDTPEYSLLHGPIGTGKTKVCIALTAEILSNPTVRNQVLYAVETNKAVDEVALRLEKVLSRAGLQRKILRLHSLPGEKSAMYPLYNQQNKPKERYFDEEFDVMATQLALVAYLHKMSDDYKAMRARGDPRRILDSMSLAGVMYRKLRTT